MYATMLRVAAASHPPSSRFSLSCRAWISGPSQCSSAPFRRCWFSTATAKAESTPSKAEKDIITVLGKEYERDDYTNVTPAILSKLDARLTEIPGHPLATLKHLIEEQFPSYVHFSPSPTYQNTERSLSAVVTPKENFEDLSFPKDHPGRSKTDSYYINRNWMLRTHTSAHEVGVFSQGHKRWLLTADVYRRDEIDASHYPVFHQMEGARIWDQGDGEDGAKERIRELEWENTDLLRQIRSERIVLEDNTLVDEGNPYQLSHDVPLANQVTLNLKYTLSLLLYNLFSSASAGRSNHDPLQIRWISAYFPFTSPSYEVEVFFKGKWLEILGCGIVQQQTLVNADVKNSIGWAFGLGLERIAMILFGIPDIRLFWSKDRRFLNQFRPNEIARFRPFSRYPGSGRDVSFWLPVEEQKATEGERFHPNDFCDLVREVAGDLAEEVTLFDKYTPPQKQLASGHYRKESHSYRINFRSMERNLESTEVNALVDEIKARAEGELGVVIR